jgi:ribosomal protein S18 acetylase RimI-like enzyme
MSTAAPQYEIRKMARADVAMAIDWAAAEGWNPGVHDAEAFFAADPEGFLVGLLDGEPIATISVVRYGASFGFLGLYIVRPEFRGRGYGLKLWNAGLAHLGQRTIGLDGVVAQQDNYRRSGFDLAHRNVRYQGAGGARGLDAAGVVPLTDLSIDEVIRYDAQLFPAERRPFIDSWIRQPRCTALGQVRDGRLAGYGVVRPAQTGYKVGPLFADAPEMAAALLDQLAARVPADATLYLDVPETNTAAVALAQSRGMSVVFETARMYAGSAPALPLHRIYGVTTFELG